MEIYQGKKAVDYLQKVLEEGYVDIYTINGATDEDTNRYYKDKFESGTRTKNENAKAYNDENAKVVDDYHLLKNNCAIQTFYGINAKKQIIENKKIRPQSLSR